MNNEELDLELDKILPLLVSADEDDDSVLDEEFLNFVDSIGIDEQDQKQEEDFYTEGEHSDENVPQEDIPEQLSKDDSQHEEDSAEEEIPAIIPEFQAESVIKPGTDAVVEKKSKKENSVLLYLHDLVYFLAVILIGTLFFRVVVVSGDSMYNTLVDGDYLLLISNVIYHDPQPGDVIVASKESFRNGESIVKRVIATEGQEVDIDFSTGTVYVDGEILDEPYVYTSTTNAEGMSFPLIVEEGCLFVMGDNRAMSMDSRDPDIGLLDCREVVGKAILLIFPGNDGGALERQFYRIGAID